MTDRASKAMLVTEYAMKVLWHYPAEVRALLELTDRKQQLTAYQALFDRYYANEEEKGRA